MIMREIVLPKDLKIIGEIALNSFHYPENPEWSVQQDEKEGLQSSIKTLQRIFPLLRIMQVFSPPLKDLFRGYIWEEEGKPVGLVLVQRRGSTNNWFVATVGVIPEFRRKGIAKKLVKAGIELIRDSGGDIILLDVIEGNTPAYSLYEKLGFNHFTGNSDLSLKLEKSYPKPQPPLGYRFEPYPLSEWEVPFELEKRLSPEEVKKYEPVKEGRFRQPRMMIPFILLLNKMQGKKSSDYKISSPSGQLIGNFSYTAQTKPSGRHILTLRIDPAHQEITAYCLESMLHQVSTISSSHLIELRARQWLPFINQEALKLGFEDRVTYHRMGLIL